MSFTERNRRSSMNRRHSVENPDSLSNPQSRTKRRSSTDVVALERGRRLSCDLTDGSWMIGAPGRVLHAASSDLKVPRRPASLMLTWSSTHRTTMLPSKTPRSNFRFHSSQCPRISLGWLVQALVDACHALRKAANSPGVAEAVAQTACIAELLEVREGCTGGSARRG